MGLQLRDTAFEHERGEEVRLMCMVEVAQEIAAEWIVATSDEWRGVCGRRGCFEG